ncbi:GNAT family N-acetyltransferase [Humibacter ginsenosidimutans]|uniref:GNAT family N-acetyltransferase n=1 Tax=Humibacter ginsenosidimutans TaxID=2599293 RepID=A0A5B8M741_9MICO|nr:GNAT family protein [Humibacter ginsenosidimutans]QDZ15270.1 GNAT family N-acetyltransferase [Humibacter ginsenosidimutans]
MTRFADTPTLTGPIAVLEPLSPEHADELGRAAADGELWKLWYTSVPRPEDMATAIEWRLGMQREGAMAPWAIRNAASGDLVGMTTFCNISPENLRVEIGHTWMAQSAHRTGINADAKRLLLGRAFDTLGCNAVYFHTHWHNHQSRAAIERLGAKQDGVLRSYQVFKGVVRDTVTFSILTNEWDAVRHGLDARIERHVG